MLIPPQWCLDRLGRLRTHPTLVLLTRPRSLVLSIRGKDPTKFSDSREIPRWLQLLHAELGVVPTVLRLRARLFLTMLLTMLGPLVKVGTRLFAVSRIGRPG